MSLCVHFPCRGGQHEPYEPACLGYTHTCTHIYTDGRNCSSL